MKIEKSSSANLKALLQLASQMFSIRIMVNFVFLLFFIFPFKALAMDVAALYLGSERIERGLILRVDNRSIWMASLNGNIVKVGRFEVIGMALYEVPFLPLSEIQFNTPQLPLVQFETLENSVRKVLVEGWPVAFDTEHIQVLNKEGNEILVPRNEIWGLQSVEFKGTIHVQSAEKRPIRFRHPLSFEDYPQERPQPGELALKPTQTLQDSLALKRYFDTFAEGYKKLDDYADRQRFYSQPHYFSNRTYLGAWYLLGSRNVNVGGRRSNVVPYVQAMGSSGPFSFQYEVVSGVAPRPWGVDAEPMAQTSFAMKDAYIVFDAFFDPTRLLVGSRYNWKSAQLDALDSRVVSPSGGRFGLDWKYVAFQAGFLTVEHGVRNKSMFEREAPTHSALALTLRSNQSSLEIGSLNSSFKMDRHWDFKSYSVIAKSPLSDDWEFTAKYFYRTLRLQSGEPGTFSDTVHSFSIQSSWILQNRWRCELLAILDKQKLSSENPNESSKQKDEYYPKLGTGLALYF